MVSDQFDTTFFPESIFPHHLFNKINKMEERSDDHASQA